jgi:phospholipase/carboxylesterase
MNVFSVAAGRPARVAASLAKGRGRGFMLGWRLKKRRGDERYSGLVLLHGYGSNGADLIGLVPYLAPALPHTAFLAPNAPERCPGTADGRQWWPLITRSAEERLAGARRAAPVVDAFLDAQLERFALPAARLALVGFSQGAMTALWVGPRRAGPLAGIVAMSGVTPDTVETLAAEARSRPPFVLIHGDADDVVPVEGLHDTEAILKADGFEVATHISRGLGHSVDLAGMQAAAGFLRRRLG